LARVWGFAEDLRRKWGRWPSTTPGRGAGSVVLLSSRASWILSRRRIIFRGRNRREMGFAFGWAEAVTEATHGIDYYVDCLGYLDDQK
jgi:hypothetical protein